MKKHLLFFFSAVLISISSQAQLVNNGSITGAPCANSGINTGNAASWSGCGFSPDLCCLAMPSYIAASQVPACVSPDGGTWLGIAALAECARTTIGGLTIGTTYTLYFCGACFGTTGVYNGTPSTPRIIVGTSTFVPTIPMVGCTWNKYSMTFVASAATMTLQCDHPNGSNSYASLDGFSLSSSSPCGPVVLPIELVDFTAAYNKNQKQVDLKWTVAMEKNLNYYSIEYSDDAITFNEVNRLYNTTGNSNGIKKYTTEHRSPYNNKVNYYRLKEVDVTGEYHYSDTRSVYFSDKDAELILVPNPAKDAVTLNFSSETEKAFSIVIYDDHGKKLKDIFHYANAGNNAVDIDIMTLEKGLFFVMVSDGAQVCKRKLIKH